MFQINQYVDNMSGDEEDTGDDLYDFRKDGGENTATRTDTITNDLVMPNQDPPADPPVLGTESTNEPPPPVENASIASSTTGTVNEMKQEEEGKEATCAKVSSVYVLLFSTFVPHTLLFANTTISSSYMMQKDTFKNYPSSYY